MPLLPSVETVKTEPSVTLEPYTADGAPDAGKKTYDEQCASCHGFDGWSAEAPSLAGIVLQETASDAFLRYATLMGRPGTTMPGFKLEDQEMADLIVRHDWSSTPIGSSSSFPPTNRSPNARAPAVACEPRSSP